MAAATRQAQHVRPHVARLFSGRSLMLFLIIPHNQRLLEAGGTAGLDVEGAGPPGLDIEGENLPHATY